MSIIIVDGNKLAGKVSWLVSKVIKRRTDMVQYPHLIIMGLYIISLIHCCLVYPTDYPELVEDNNTQESWNQSHSYLGFCTLTPMQNHLPFDAKGREDSLPNCLKSNPMSTRNFLYFMLRFNIHRERKCLSQRLLKPMSVKLGLRLSCLIDDFAQHHLNCTDIPKNMTCFFDDQKLFSMFSQSFLMLMKRY